jgi:hypothetical protein
MLFYFSQYVSIMELLLQNLIQSFISFLELQETEVEEAVGAKTESKSETPATENKSETEKSVPAMKKDGENAPPQKTVSSKLFNT